MKLIKIIIPCLLFCGCFGTSKTAKFYTQSSVATGVISSENTSFIGVNRMQLPKYVDRPQMVTQQKDSVEITISEYNRWVELPSVLASRVLTEDLSTLLPSAQVKMSQSKGEGFDWLITVEVSKIDVVLGDKAEMVAWYTIKDHAKKLHTQQKFAHSVAVGPSYADIPNAYSQLLAELAREIATSLTKK